MAKEKESGLSNYIPISRKLFEHHFWIEKRVFSRAEAWIDLVRSVSYESNNGKIINGQWVKWGRAEMPVSLRYLGSRWKWSRSKVSLFCDNLRRENMIKLVTAERTVITILTICNYETYNIVSKKKSQQNGQSRDSEGTVEGQSRDKIKKVNKVKEGKEYDARTENDNALFVAFSTWIDKHAPKVNQMKEPIAINHFEKLKKDYPGEAGKTMIQDVLLAMQNKVDLLKKYESANLTLRSWINIRKKNNGESVNYESTGQKLSAAISLIHKEGQQ